MAIRQKSGEPRFWEMMDSFVLLAYARLAASRTLLQQLLAYMNLLYTQTIYPFGANEKNDFYELEEQHKQLKSMEMSETSPDTFDEGYIHQLQPEPTLKIH